MYQHHINSRIRLTLSMVSAIDTDETCDRLTGEKFSHERNLDFSQMNSRFKNKIVKNQQTFLAPSSDRQRRKQNHQKQEFHCQLHLPHDLHLEISRQ